MRLFKYFIIFSSILLCPALQAQEQVRFAFYNVLNFPQAPPSNRLQILSAIVDDMRPDIFMIAELESEAGGTDILVQSLQEINTNFESAPYINNTSSGADLQQLLYYDSSKFSLLQSSIIQTTVRDINRYQLETITEDPEIFEVFVCHLKASSGEANELLRLDMVLEFTEFLDTIDPSTHIIFAGDLNLYGSDEPAYQELLDTTNSIALIDPIDMPGAWNNNATFATTHTQSTRLSSDEFDNFGAGGGLDSRFDFILLSENFLDPNAPLQYINSTYKSYGNNGNCYNDRIDNTVCDGEYNSTLRSLLYQMSDHLPVITDIKISDEFLSVKNHIDTNQVWNLVHTIATSTLTITLSQNENKPVRVSIYDQTGRIVKMEMLTNNTINVRTLAEGFYYIIAENHQWPVLKFIKRN